MAASQSARLPSADAVAETECVHPVLQLLGPHVRECCAGMQAFRILHGGVQ
jgi:hypothetical protein